MAISKGHMHLGVDCGLIVEQSSPDQDLQLDSQLPQSYVGVSLGKTLIGSVSCITTQCVNVCVKCERVVRCKEG